VSQLVFITHPVYFEHNTGPAHPERPDRLAAILDHLKQSSLDKHILKTDAICADENVLQLVHPEDYIRNVTESVASGTRMLDGGDTIVCEKSVEAATFAAGAMVRAVDLLHQGASNRAFCMVRPPGHHAEKDQAMGFCIFNNVAVAARYAQHISLAEKVLIIDWDVHHGNGTQHIFEADDSVFYYSLHQYPFYPGTGNENETGIQKGSGYTLNRPLPAGSDDDTYIESFTRDMEEIEKRFKADLVIISAGFDAHRDDPLAGMMLTEKAYARFTEIVIKYAWRYSQGRILSALEGGYNLAALARSTVVHISSLLKQ
jgi:acetoin utilization deacetylase AcuC-like enzyme